MPTHLSEQPLNALNMPDSDPSQPQDFHPPRPDAEHRFYAVTAGRQPGVYTGL